MKCSPLRNEPLKLYIEICNALLRCDFQAVFCETSSLKIIISYNMGRGQKVVYDLKSERTEAVRLNSYNPAICSK